MTGTLLGSPPDSTFSWKRLLVPTDFVSTVRDDVSNIAFSCLNFQDEKVKAAGKRAICAFGMAIAVLMLGVTAWNLFWYSVSISIKVGVCAGIYLICRDIFERSKGEKGSFAELSEKGAALAEQADHLAAIYHGAHTMLNVPIPVAQQ